MKTIEERAKEYADRHQSNELNFGLGRVYGYQRIYNAELIAYERGAKEQKAIDIDKACEWIKENVECGVHPQSAYGFADRFLRAMGEE